MRRGSQSWGFNLGADVSYFVTRVVGMGGNLRYTRGATEIVDADLLSDGPQKAEPGGLQMGGGVRFRF
jgi:hypothetical protein